MRVFKRVRVKDRVSFWKSLFLGFAFKGVSWFGS